MKKLIKLSEAISKKINEKIYKTNIAVVLLFQGDQWRIDALRVINETLLK